MKKLFVLLVPALCYWFSESSLGNEPMPIESIIANLDGVSNTVYNVDVSSPACTIVHIKQLHLNHIGKNPNKAVEAYLSDLQDQIAAIIMDLCQGLGLGGYFCEGVHEENVVRMNAMASAVRTRSQSLPNLQTILAQEEWRKFEVLQLRAAVRGNLIVFQTEFQRDHAKALEVKRTLRFLPQIATNFVIMKNREKNFLSILSRTFCGKTNQYAPVVFGAGHDFTDQVVKWNATNDFHFSLITITPQLYDERWHEVR